MVTDASVFNIRNIKEISELRAVEDLQKEIWGCTDREVLPCLTLIPLLDVGGVLLGAFAGEELIGFSLGFPGLEDGRPTLHSDMLGVKREHRSHGLGYKLKLAQRQGALARGIDRITWTFDPLQSRNAYLNFAKLGVVSNRYKNNYYGETSSFLHTIGTDRLWVTWDLETERVRDRLENGPTYQPAESSDLPKLVSVGDDNAPVSEEYSGTGRAVIEIPGGIDSLAETTPELAQRWRAATRTAFGDAIGAGLIAEEFFRVESAARSVGTYLLNKKS
jgi:predicted GNAT superfamily acetyltransferase